MTTSVVALSDTHNQHRGVRVPDGDVVIHAGDACVDGTREEVADFIQWFASLPHQHRIFVGGNHDGVVADADWRKSALAALPRWDQRRGGLLYLEGETADVWADGRKLRVHGAPWRPRPDDWPPGQPMRPGKRSSAFGVRESLIGQFWTEVPDGLDILITHVPPYGVLDKIEETPLAVASRIGCQALAARLATLTHPPQVHIFGHVHDPGGQNVVTERGTRAYNVAICGPDGGASREPQVVEL